MSTTVHLPADLLAIIDRRAHGLGMSRNRYIVRALERAVATEARWSARLVAELDAAGADSEGRQALVELRAAIAANRTSKEPPTL